MREILITNRFKKDLKKAKKNPRQDTDKLLSAIETLATHGILSEDYLPDCLSGKVLTYQVAVFQCKIWS